MESRQTEIIGEAYKTLKDLVKKYAQEDIPVLFIGETGCGKERCAKLYMESNGREGPKQTENCGAVSDQLLRSEVFGHVKGAYTDAKVNRAGLLRTCDNGILFLDELGDATPNFQAAIVRVTEGHGFRPLGSDRVETVDTLIIAATNRPVRIREDLKHRFEILPVPPLQKFDIPALAEHHLGKPLKEDVLKTLMARDYPGNVRELKKDCKRLYVEKGDAIFSKKASTNMIRVGTFDYQRFRWEFSVWDKYISPILLKHDLNYQYKYFPISTSSHAKDESPGSRTISQGIKRNRNTRIIPDLVKKESELVKNLLIGKGDEETLKEFTIALDNHFSLGDLGSFLRGLDKYIGHNVEFKKLKPDLAPLLDLGWYEAEKRFKLEYFNYNLQIHNDDRGETAKHIGMEKKTLDSTLLRLTDTSKSTSGTKV